MMKRLKSMLLLLLTLCLLLTGCGSLVEEKGFMIGFVTNRGGAIELGAKSVTDTFNKVDVSFDLYYGFYNKDRINNNNEKLFSYQQLDEKIIFVIYISDVDYNESTYVNTGTIIEDYKNIDGYYLVKEISGEEVLSGEYGYIITSQKVKYDYNEKIIIPSELFKFNKGIIRIKIQSFRIPEKENENYLASYTAEIMLKYEVIDNDTIKITEN